MRITRAAVLSILLSLMVTGCSPTPEIAPSLSPDFPFPLAVGTSWEYFSERYEFLAGKQSRALYSVVDTVVDTSELLTYLVFQVDRSENLVSSEGGWEAPPPSPSTYWYLARAGHLYRAFDLEQIISEPSALHLLYPFPLQDGLSWCPIEGFPLDKCIASGKRTATLVGLYETPAGRFEGCFLISDDFSTGDSSEAFCPHVGIVHQRFDHSGAPFGFENTLVSLRNPQEQ